LRIAHLRTPEELQRDLAAILQQTKVVFSKASNGPTGRVEDRDFDVD